MDVLPQEWSHQGEQLIAGRGYFDMGQFDMGYLDMGYDDMGYWKELEELRKDSQQSAQSQKNKKGGVQSDCR